MAVKHVQGRVFLRHVAQHRQQNNVFQNVGVVSGVEGVAVTKHGAMVTVHQKSSLKLTQVSYNRGLRSAKWLRGEDANET
jgi:hypothetical protein